ncbi:hypothetical protein [Afipia sp. 1NLS2]|uniref:hypothetical protein n=1 Tax=Afipia sp. 1NLS2 TaxID=666684 RepID=UPI0001DA158B|nr:hypothetical protein [Afipia sp. 1NLS2]EFI53569.1 hypothetical protein AfiDRAFT_1556 [Afipia sp. 1NLS2]
MLLLTFIKRIWSPYTSNVGTKTRSEGVEDKKPLSERERDARILELLDNPTPSGETIGELAELMGQTDKPKF